MHGHGSTIKPDVGEEATWQGRWFNSFPPTLSSWPNVKSLSICNYFNSVTRGDEALITMHRIAMKRNHNFFPELYEMGWKEEERRRRGGGGGGGATKNNDNPAKMKISTDYQPRNHL
ncbi:hypothetical protein OIU85_013095 [Salix viminalis]|uniref:Uncharacterized protein n=1 Tax=Salix viminalis TaxID=40686 RepID=A0A9Q0NQU5_SALVM|nr:hypothetical protein OIU85_013095 [Salix viminalis]